MDPRRDKQVERPFRLQRRTVVSCKDLSYRVVASIDLEGEQEIPPELNERMKAPDAGWFESPAIHAVMLAGEVALAGELDAIRSVPDGVDCSASADPQAQALCLSPSSQLICGLLV